MTQGGNIVDGHDDHVEYDRVHGDVGVGEESTAVVGHADTFTVNFAHQLVVGMTGADVIVAQGRE